MKTLLIGIGAAGNKAVVEAVERNVVNVEDTIIVNSTSKDFPKNYEGVKIVLSDGDTGCGKERAIAKEYTKQAIGDGKFNFNSVIGQYITVIIVTSVEGGTGSGATPIIAKLLNQVYTRNTHIIAFTGFEDDVRGLSNTVEFFKEIDPAIVVQTISNSAYLSESSGNKLKAEALANKEMCERISVLTGQDFIEGSQNIDDTDILKLSNTSGYMTVEKKYFNKSLETRDDFERIIKNMIYNSSSVKSNKPSAARLGVVLNIKEASEDAIDYSFTSLKNAYGNPFEFFTQVQWDGKQEYIAYIASGMRMPIDEIEAVYNRYKEQSEKINKNGDEFFSRINTLEKLEEDDQFNMIKNGRAATSLADFLDNN
jgi:cell division GTPase FtsZ